MAYMNQEKKAKIAAALKLFMPKDWKYSLAVENHSAIILTIISAPIDLLALNDGNRGINEFYLEKTFSGEILEIFQNIKAAMNIDNFNLSDSQSDYFHVGHYVTIQLGKWDKPFVLLQVTENSQPGDDVQEAEIIKQAGIRFGRVHGFIKNNNGSFKIAIERKEPVFNHLPFMTITAGVYGITNDGDFMVDFRWGHYDLDEKSALSELMI